MLQNDQPHRHLLSAETFFLQQDYSYWYQDGTSWPTADFMVRNIN